MTKNILFYFYNSKTYKIFIKSNAFFKNTILGNADKSAILNLVRKIVKGVTLKDAGMFIILVVLFNTLTMLALGKEIDVFSVLARVFFFIAGVVFYVRDMRLRKK